MIRPLEMADISAVVDIHLSCFPDSNATKFGRQFLLTYHAGYCGPSRAVAYVYAIEGRIVGFIVGGVNIRALTREMIGRSKMAFTLSVVRNLTTHPVRTAAKVWQIVKSFLLPKKDTFYSDDTAGLASFAVLPEFRGRGIAQELIRAFLTELCRRGIHACRVGVKADNMIARRVYEKMGFAQVNDEGTIYVLRLGKGP